MKLWTLLKTSRHRGYLLWKSCIIPSLLYNGSCWVNSSKNRAVRLQWVQGLLPTSGPGHMPRSQLSPHGGKLWYRFYGQQGNKKKILYMSHLHIYQADSQSSMVLCETYIMLWVILDTQFACNMFFLYKYNNLFHTNTNLIIDRFVSPRYWLDCFCSCCC